MNLGGGFGIFFLYRKNAIQFFLDCSLVITDGSAALYFMISDILSRIFEDFGFILSKPQVCFVHVFPIFFFPRLIFHYYIVSSL